MRCEASIKEQAQEPGRLKETKASSSRRESVETLPFLGVFLVDCVYCGVYLSGFSY